MARAESRVAGAKAVVKGAEAGNWRERKNGSGQLRRDQEREGPKGGAEASVRTKGAEARIDDGDREGRNKRETNSRQKR